MQDMLPGTETQETVPPPDEIPYDGSGSGVPDAS
jgi:hypothetical protein